jgi:hypothetical protein
MPQAWITSTSKSSRSDFIIAGGQAEPPITVRLNGGEAQLVLLHVVHQAEPDGGDAGAEGHALLFEQAVERGAVQVRPGHHQLGARERRGEREDPRR